MIANSNDLESLATARWATTLSRLLSQKHICPIALYVDVLKKLLQKTMCEDVVCFAVLPSLINDIIRFVAFDKITQRPQVCFNAFDIVSDEHKWNAIDTIVNVSRMVKSGSKDPIWEIDCTNVDHITPYCLNYRRLTITQVADDDTVEMATDGLSRHKIILYYDKDIFI